MSLQTQTQPPVCARTSECCEPGSWKLLLRRSMHRTRWMQNPCKCQNAHWIQNQSAWIKKSENLWSPVPAIFLGSLTAESSPKVLNIAVTSSFVAWIKNSISHLCRTSNTWKGMFLTRSLVLGFSMLALLSSVLPLLLPALSDLVVQKWKEFWEHRNDHESRKQGLKAW